MVPKAAVYVCASLDSANRKWKEQKRNIIDHSQLHLLHT